MATNKRFRDGGTTGIPEDAQGTVYVFGGTPVKVVRRVFTGEPTGAIYAEVKALCYHMTQGGGNQDDTEAAEWFTVRADTIQASGATVEPPA